MCVCASRKHNSENRHISPVVVPEHRKKRKSKRETADSVFSSDTTNRETIRSWKRGNWSRAQNDETRELRLIWRPLIWLSGWIVFWQCFLQKFSVKTETVKWLSSKEGSCPRLRKKTEGATLKPLFALYSHDVCGLNDLLITTFLPLLELSGQYIENGRELQCVLTLCPLVCTYGPNRSKTSYLFRRNRVTWRQLVTWVWHSKKAIEASGTCKKNKRKVWKCTVYTH